MSKVDTSKFLYIHEYQEKDLSFILNSIYKCYLKIISSRQKINNNENDIRDVFLSDEYLENHIIKEELSVVEFQFDKEIQTKDGRVDIRVFSMPKKMNGEDKPYYYIECKRIKGDKSYNEKYINEGINRFVEEKYPTYMEANAMLGFVVKSIDISKNMECFPDLKKLKFIDEFEYSYISTHKTILTTKDIILYHLMLDFSDIVNSTHTKTA